MGAYKQRFRFKDFYQFEGFKFRDSYLEDGAILIELTRTRSTGICPCCGIRCRHIHHTRSRRVRDLSVVNTPVFIAFTSYQLDCACGYNGYETLSFVDEYSRYTRRFEERVVILCVKMTIKDAASELGISWDAVKNIDKKHLRKYLIPLDEAHPTSIGIDEIAYEKGQHYLTVVRDGDLGKVIWVGEGRKKESLDEFFKALGPAKSWAIKRVVMDMWDPYIASVRANTDALIIFDKFHIAKKINEAVDAVRKQEFAKADPSERKAMKHKRFLILARRKNLDEEKRETLRELITINTTLEIAYLLKEQVLDIFDERNREVALSRLAKWFRNVADAGIESFDAVVKTMQHYIYGIINYFDCPLTNAASEGFNNKINVIKRRAYGFRDLEYFKLKILETCGIRPQKS